MAQHNRVLLVDSSGNPVVTVPFQFDDTDKLAVSLYGKASAAGDQEVLAGANSGLRIGQYINWSTTGDGAADNTRTVRGHDDNVAMQWVRHWLFNGTSWDRPRNNEEITLLASAARTAQVDSVDQVNYNHQGMILFVDVTVDAAAGAITPNILVKDPVSGTAKTIWTAAAAIAATGQFAYLLLPGCADAGSYTEQKELAIPRTWLFRMTVADTDSLTYSVSCCML